MEKNSDKTDPVKGPHQQAEIETYGATADKAKVAMIMVHGRGATASGMLQLAREFSTFGVHYIAPQAKDHEWYPYSFLTSREKNEPGISSGLQLLQDLLASLEKHGIPKEKTILLGFSQGACLTTEFAARHPQKFGGVVALSGGLIGPQIDSNDYTGSLDQTPVFIGCSDYDPHVPQRRIDETAAVFKKLGANVNLKIYPGMGHTINADEIRVVREMIEDVNSV